MFAGLLAGLPAARSVPWPGPVQTVHSGCADGPQIPKPTEGPRIELGVGELKRDLGVPPNTCGWVDGNSDSEYTAEHSSENGRNNLLVDRNTELFRCVDC